MGWGDRPNPRSWKDLGCNETAWMTPYVLIERFFRVMLRHSRSVRRDSLNDQMTFVHMYSNIEARDYHHVAVGISAASCCNMFDKANALIARLK